METCLPSVKPCQVSMETCLPSIKALLGQTGLPGVIYVVTRPYKQAPRPVKVITTVGIQNAQTKILLSKGKVRGHF